MAARLPGLLTVPAPPSPVADVEGLQHAFLAGLGAAGMSVKTAAATMQMQRSHLSRAITDGQLPMGRLLRLPKSFWRAFLPLVAALSGAEQPEPHKVMETAAAALVRAACPIGQLEERSA